MNFPPHLCYGLRSAEEQDSPALIGIDWPR